ncbi:MAG: UDP-3-O-(3-hydroxymyristoyl)glucosamine N-acyltransferase [Bradymonadia bacterium]
MTESVPLTDIVHWTTAEVSGDPPKAITQLASLNEATHSQLSVYLSKRWREVASKTHAGAVLVERANITDLPSSTALLIVEDARAAWHHVIRRFAALRTKVTTEQGIRQNAVVHPTANVSPTASIAAYAVIEADTFIGEDVVIESHTVVGKGCRIGARTVIASHVSIGAGSLIGQSCQIGPGSCIGSHGFGVDAVGLLPHLGWVEVANGVTIGANVCIDRGTVSPTRIGAQTHIDNLVQIGHNVQIGSRVRICGQVGIAGGAVIEDDVILGGQVGVADRVVIGKGSRVAAKSGVTKSLKPNLAYSGYPAEPNQRRLRRMARQRRESTE